MPPLYPPPLPYTPYSVRKRPPPPPLTAWKTRKPRVGRPCVVTLKLIFFYRADYINVTRLTGPSGPIETTDKICRPDNIIRTGRGRGGGSVGIGGRGQLFYAGPANKNKYRSECFIYSWIDFNSTGAGPSTRDDILSDFRNRNPPSR